MNAKPTFAEQGSISTFAAAAVATIIAFGILSAVAFLFQSDGKPMERLAAAERACEHLSYQSERQACMNEWFAAAQSGTLARR